MNRANMRLIVAEPVYKLLVLERATVADSRMFLCKVYLQAEGGEPSWAILHDYTNKREGIRLRSQEFTLWCDKEDQESLENMVLVKGPEGGFIAVPTITLTAQPP